MHDEHIRAPVQLTRRRLLQAALASAAVGSTGPLLSACGRDPAPGYAHGREAGVWENWSRSQNARPHQWLEPDSESALVQALRDAARPVRPVGASHSFSPIVPSDGSLLSLDRLKGLISHDSDAMQATFHAGTRIREVGQPLQAIGQGLINQGDVDPQALAGAIATSTHGTGITLGSFSSLVTALRLVTPQGDILDCSPDENADVFRAATTSVGALGVVSRVTLQNRAAYSLREREYTAPLKQVLANTDSLCAAHRHFEFFAFFHSDRVLVKTLDETDDAPTPPSRLDLPVDSILWLASELAHNVPSADGLMQKMLTSLFPGSERVGRSYEIFPSPREVAFNEMEYELPVANGPDCLEEIIATVRRSGIRTLFPIEYRYVAADESWLSPFYRQACASISIHQYWKVDHRPLFNLVEPILRRYGGRPHWGKLHTLDARDLAELYPRWDDFHAVRRRLDPDNRMLNRHLRHVFLGGMAT